MGRHIAVHDHCVHDALNRWRSDAFGDDTMALVHTHTSLSIDRLDDLVAERLTWLARFSSGVAHELGNLVLVSSILEPAKGADSQAGGRRAVQGAADLRQHLRFMLEGIDLWRRLDNAPVRPCTVKQWWTQYGYMLRQFLTPPARLTMMNSAETRVVDAAALCRSLAALLIAIDAQIRPLDKVSLNILDGEPDACVRITIETAPGRLSAGTVIPSVASQALMHSGEGGTPVIGYSNQTLEMIVRTMLPDATVKAAPETALRSAGK